MSVTVFIENPAGVALKHHFDERCGALRGVSNVSRPYPYPYGFVLDAPAADGDHLDCFVLTRRPLTPGALIECELLGLMEQWEDELIDHNLIARPIGEPSQLTQAVQTALVDFVSHVFAHMPGKRVRPGRFLDAHQALCHLVALKRG